MKYICYVIICISMFISSLASSVWLVYKHNDQFAVDDRQNRIESISNMIEPIDGR